MLKPRNIYASFILFSILTPTFVILNQVADVNAITFNDFYEKKLTGRELVSKFEYENTESNFVADRPIFWNIDDAYFAPSYDYLVHSYYQLYVESNSIKVWRDTEESTDYFIRPEQFAKCLEAVQEVVNDLYFEPNRWRWDLVLIIAGSSLGGIG